MNTRSVDTWGAPTVWNVREDGKLIGQIKGRFTAGGKPYWMISRGRLGDLHDWPDTFNTFAEAEAMVREI